MLISAIPMTAYQGLVFFVQMNAGRKVSELEREILLDISATSTLGYEIPAGLQKQSIAYQPADDVIEKIRRLTINPDLEALFQMAVISAEETITQITEEAPPTHDISLRTLCAQIVDQSGTRYCYAMVSKIEPDGKVIANFQPPYTVGVLPRTTLDLDKEYVYKDWKEKSDYLADALPQAYFVAHLNTAGNTGRAAVQLRLQRASQSYTQQEGIIYDSGERGFLNTLYADKLEAAMLDHAQLKDGQRLPAVAALLAAEEHIRIYLEISKKGKLDTLSPLRQEEARYHLCVTHTPTPNYHFGVSLRMADAMNGNPFGQPMEFIIDLESGQVSKKG